MREIPTQSETEWSPIPAPRIARRLRRLHELKIDLGVKHGFLRVLAKALFCWCAPRSYVLFPLIAIVALIPPAIPVGLLWWRRNIETKKIQSIREAVVRRDIGQQLVDLGKLAPEDTEGEYEENEYINEARTQFLKIDPSLSWVMDSAYVYLQKTRNLDYLLEGATSSQSTQLEDLFSRRITRPIDPECLNRCALTEKNLTSELEVCKIICQEFP